jgi:hypothetical protein
VEVFELAHERFAMGLEHAHRAVELVGFAALVAGRRLLEPRRREGQPSQRVGEVERDLLLVFANVEQLDPRAVPPGVVREPDGAGDRPSAVPPRRTDNRRRQPFAETLEQAVDDVDVVHHAAEIGVGERDHRLGRAVADRLLHLLRGGAVDALDHLRGHVARLDDLALGEKGHPFRVVARHPHIPQRNGRGWQLCAHPLPRRVVPLHVADLHDLRGAIASGDDAVGVGEHDGERFLDEDVQPRLERVDGDVGVRRGGRRDQDRVEAAGVEERSVIGMHRRDPVPGCHRLADAAAGIGERRDLETVV